MPQHTVELWQWHSIDILLFNTNRGKTKPLNNIRHALFLCKIWNIKNKPYFSYIRADLSQYCVQV